MTMRFFPWLQLSEHDRDRQNLQDAFDDLLLEQQTLVRRVSALEKEKQDALNTQETWRTKFRKVREDILLVVFFTISILQSGCINDVNIGISWDNA